MKESTKALRADRRAMRKSGMRVVEAKSMILIPPAPDRCQVCATKHEPDQPHNQQSMFYQVGFHLKKGRFPAWADAMAHCDEPTKEIWTRELRARGAKI